MSLFNNLNKEEKRLDFTDIDSHEKVKELFEKGVLYPVYLMPLRFNGEESDCNCLYVPKVVVELKEHYDNMVENLLVQGKVNGYSCTPEYKGDSFVPSRLKIEAKSDEKAIFTEIINIW